MSFKAWEEANVKEQGTPLREADQRWLKELERQMRRDEATEEESDGEQEDSEEEGLPAAKRGRGQGVAYRVGNLSNADISDFFVYRRVYRIEPPISSISIFSKPMIFLSFFAENSKNSPKIPRKFRKPMNQSRQQQQQRRKFQKFAENSENSPKIPQKEGLL